MRICSLKPFLKPENLVNFRYRATFFIVQWRWIEAIVSGWKQTIYGFEDLVSRIIAPYQFWWQFCGVMPIAIYHSHHNQHRVHTIMNAFVCLPLLCMVGNELRFHFPASWQPHHQYTSILIIHPDVFLYFQNLLLKNKKKINKSVHVGNLIGVWHQTSGPIYNAAIYNYDGYNAAKRASKCLF